MENHLGEELLASAGRAPLPGEPHGVTLGIREGCCPDGGRPAPAAALMSLRTGAGEAAQLGSAIWTGLEPQGWREGGWELL